MTLKLARRNRIQILLAGEKSKLASWISSNGALFASAVERSRSVKELIYVIEMFRCMC